MDPFAPRQNRPPQEEPPVWTGESSPAAEDSASEAQAGNAPAAGPATPDSPTSSYPAVPPPPSLWAAPRSPDPWVSRQPAETSTPAQPADPWSRPQQGDPWATQQHQPDPWTPQQQADPWAPPQPELEPVGGPRRPSRMRMYGGFFGVAIFAAILASAGTYGALGLTGNLDRTSLATPAVTSALGQQTIAGVSPAPAATPAPATNVQGTTDVVTAAARVRPAVVTIDVAGTGSANGLPGQGSGGGVGSGIIFDSNGWILTNRHVVTDGGALTVILSDGRQFKATTYGTDTLTDLAIVKVDATGLPAAQLGTSATLQVGQTAIAVGDPLGNYPDSVTAGIVSGLNRSIQVTGESLSDLIQTDAAINPGNSGGALADIDGRVIGINTAASSSAQGMGFAIPIDLAKPLMQQAMAGQKLARPWLGIRYIELDPTIASENKLSVTAGAWISSDGTNPAVESGSPADKAGLKENDVIVAIDGVKVDGSHPLIELMSSHAPGSSVTLTVHRGSQTLTLTLTLSTRPAGVQ